MDNQFLSYLPIYIDFMIFMLLFGLIHYSAFPAAKVM